MLMKILFVLLAGGFGGLTSGLLVWALGALGVTPTLGFNMVPDLTVGWMGRRVGASAVWGLIFLIPIYRNAPWIKGAVLGLLPWLSSILWVLPQVKGAGFLGMDLGIGTPVWTLFFGVFWGISGTLFLEKFNPQGRDTNKGES